MYRDDPRWITLRYPTACEGCERRLPRGAKAYYYPLGKHVYCQECGKPHAAEFASAIADEQNNCW